MVVLVTTLGRLSVNQFVGQTELSIGHVKSEIRFGCQVEMLKRTNCTHLGLREKS